LRATSATGIRPRTINVRPSRNNPFPSAIRNCILKASAETGLTRAACALHRAHSPDLSFGRCGSPCHTSKFGPPNRLKCRPSIMTHPVAENETSHSVSAVSRTEKPSPRKYRSEADWPGVEPRNTARQGPREKLRRFHDVTCPKGASRLPVEAQRTGYGGTSPGNVPHRSVRKTSVCGVIPRSSSQWKQGLKSVPPPPIAVSVTGWPAGKFQPSAPQYRSTEHR
jgi:hypothetical protein